MHGRVVKVDHLNKALRSYTRRFEPRHFWKLFQHLKYLNNQKFYWIDLTIFHPKVSKLLDEKSSNQYNKNFPGKFLLD